MARLRSDYLDQVQRRFDELAIREALRDQARRDVLLDRVGEALADGWLSREAAACRARLARANGDARQVAAENQQRLITAWRRMRDAIDVHDAAETAADHGLRPEDLRNKVSGRRRRHKKPAAEFAFRYRGE